ncbi:unnamed protein product, partial [Trichogramma brassicae]
RSSQKLPARAQDQPQRRHGHRTRRARLADWRIFAQNSGDLWLRSSAAHALRYVVHIGSCNTHYTRVPARARGLNSNAASHNCNSRHRTIINSSRNRNSSSSSREPCACRAAVHPPSRCIHTSASTHSCIKHTYTVHGRCAHTACNLLAAFFPLSFFFLLGRSTRLRYRENRPRIFTLVTLFSLSRRLRVIAKNALPNQIRGVKQETHRTQAPLAPCYVYMGTRCLAEDEKGLKCTRNRTERRMRRTRGSLHMYMHDIHPPQARTRYIYIPTAQSPSNIIRQTLSSSAGAARRRQQHRQRIWHRSSSSNSSRSSSMREYVACTSERALTTKYDDENGAESRFIQVCRLYQSLLNNIWTNLKNVPTNCDFMCFPCYCQARQSLGRSYMSKRFFVLIYTKSRERKRATAVAASASARRRTKGESSSPLRGVRGAHRERGKCGAKMKRMLQSKNVGNRPVHCAYIVGADTRVVVAVDPSKSERERKESGAQGGPRENKTSLRYAASAPTAPQRCKHTSTVSTPLPALDVRVYAAHKHPQSRLGRKKSSESKRNSREQDQKEQQQQQQQQPSSQKFSFRNV